MANTITNTYSGGTLTINPSVHTHAAFLDPEDMRREVNRLYTYIDHLERIMTDFEGRLEALEESNG